MPTRLLAAFLLAHPVPVLSSDSWAPPIAAFHARSDAPEPIFDETGPGVGVALIAEGESHFSREGAEKAAAEAKKRGWPVLRWSPGTLVSAALVTNEVVVAGGAGNATKAARALLRLAVRMKSRKPVVLRLLVDQLYGMDQTLARLEDPAGFYSDVMVPDWLPTDPEFMKGKSLHVQVLDRGRPRSVLSRGDGEPVIVYVDVTDVANLDRTVRDPAPKAPALKPPPKKAPTPKTTAAAAAGTGPSAGRLPGTPLDTAREPGLWLGKGDQSGQGFQGTLTKGPNGIEYGRGRFMLPSSQLSPEGHGRSDVNGVFDFDYFSENGVTRGRADFSLLGPVHGFSLRYLQDKSGILSSSLFRGAYLNHLSLGGFANDFTAKVGFLKTAEVRSGGGRREDEGQFLYGAGDTVSYGLDLRHVSLVAEAGADVVYSHIAGRDEWDNRGVHGGVQATIPIRQDLHLIGQYKHRVVQTNPERYFFMHERRDDQALGGFSYKSRRGFGAGVLGGVQVTEGEQAADTKKKAGAWVSAFRTTLTGLAVRGNWMDQYTVGLAHQITKEWNAELFLNKDRAKDGSWRKDTIGMAVNWGFGGGSGTPDERRYRPQTGDLYSQRYYQDRGLPQDRFEGQMDSVRKANEWAGSNLTWVTGAQEKWARTPKETYGGRSGDCDEQAWLVSRALNDNPRFQQRGGKAHILDYWTGTGGHGVSLVEEGGKVYVNEYGRNYLVKVDPNASMNEKAKAALQQVGPYLALPTQNGKPLTYSVFRTDDPPPTLPGRYDYGYFDDANLASDWVYVDSFEVTAKRKPVETGVGALVGLDAF